MPSPGCRAEAFATPPRGDERFVFLQFFDATCQQMIVVSDGFEESPDVYLILLTFQLRSS
jgi:hypothetical protein